MSTHRRGRDEGFLAVAENGEIEGVEGMRRREFLRDSFVGASGLSNLDSRLKNGLGKTLAPDAASSPGVPAAQDNSQRASVASLSQHFIDPSGNISPWMFIPEDNIKSVSTTEHRGFVTIRAAGEGKDIKGLLKEPIRLDQYRMPWAFHLGIVQNQQAMKGVDENQINYAIGLNLVVTFSEPSTWPQDRTQAPPDARSLQLFVVHLGNQGESYRQGVPQVRRTELNFHDPAPEVYLIVGRGDLAPNMNGNWKMPYTWVGPEPSPSGSWSKEGGPAAYNVRFRVALNSPTQLEVGVGYSAHSGWRYRSVDVAEFGRITGIWEIGPIISLDRWIPDTLPSVLGLEPYPWIESYERRAKFLALPDRQHDTELTHVAPKVGEGEKIEALMKLDPPNPSFEYFVDYAVFHSLSPEDFEEYSDDFDIPGFLGDQKYYNEGAAIVETYSHRGYLTVTLMGMNNGWAMFPIMYHPLDLAKIKPPLEVETSIIFPDDTSAWHLNMIATSLINDQGKDMGAFAPGIQNIPGQGRKFINAQPHLATRVEHNKQIPIEFESELPQSLLTHKPLFMLMQVMDDSHLRVGLKAHKTDPWQFSKVFDTSATLGKIAKVGFPPYFLSLQGVVGQQGWGSGNYPSYTQFLIDYIHLRRKVTT
jgi:hypothetical protein